MYAEGHTLGMLIISVYARLHTIKYSEKVVNNWRVTFLGAFDTLFPSLLCTPGCQCGILFDTPTRYIKDVDNLYRLVHKLPF